MLTCETPALMLSALHRICPALSVGIVGAAVCGLIATALVDYITSRYYTSWRCYEFTFSYSGVGRGVKEVPASYC